MPTPPPSTTPSAASSRRRPRRWRGRRPRRREHSPGTPRDTPTSTPAPASSRTPISAPPASPRPFVAATVLQLVAEGRVALDAPIETYLPGRIHGTGIDANAITVRQLLRHQSGLPEYFDADTAPPDRTRDRRSASRRGTGQTRPVHARQRDDIHQHQLRHRRSADRGGHRPARRRGDHLAHHRAAGTLRHLLPCARATPGCVHRSRTATR